MVKAAAKGLHSCGDRNDITLQEALLCQLFIYEVINLWTISSWEINSRNRVLRR